MKLINQDGIAYDMPQLNTLFAEAEAEQGPKSDPEITLTRVAQRTGLDRHELGKYANIRAYARKILNMTAWGPV